MSNPASGPLVGVRIIELAGIGPNPMCAMLFADMGAEVIRVDRLQASDLGIKANPKHQLLNRGRKSIAIDLKKPEGVEIVLRLVEKADALIEGFRPGVTERLGLGPAECAERNPRLVYGRVTGWGQTGPLAPAAGHDLNYISLVGAAHAIGRKESTPPPPLNLIGDFGGGALYLALGVLAALYESRNSGKGQVIDAAMIDGVASLMTGVYGLYADSIFIDKRESNWLDGGAYFYNTYETSDGKFISIGSIERKFYKELVEMTGFEDSDLSGHADRDRWPVECQKMSKLIMSKTRDEWCELLEGTDACFSPVLSVAEAPAHPHNVEREVFVNDFDVTQPAPAPRFSRTPGAIQKPPSSPGEDTEDVLLNSGFVPAEIENLRKDQIVG